MPVVRNPQFYFKEGFCWILTLNEHSKYLKARLKNKTVNDVNAMALYTIQDLNISERYYVVLINSLFIYNYKKNFLNSSSAFQINDARQLPIIVPNKKIIKEFNDVFDQAIINKKNNLDTENQELQNKIDTLVVKLYDI